MSTSHVLVVDDEADIRALIDEILSEEGYEVTVAGDASEARAARGVGKFDLVLLDIWMPGPTASACCASGPNPETSIVRWS